MYIRCIYLGELFVARIPREVKEKMRKFRHVNWSEVVRKAIMERVALEEAREKIRVAAKIMDNIREEILRKHGPCDYDSFEVIRYWRKVRK